MKDIAKEDIQEILEEIRKEIQDGAITTEDQVWDYIWDSVDVAVSRHLDKDIAEWLVTHPGEAEEAFEGLRDNWGIDQERGLFDLLRGCYFYYLDNEIHQRVVKEGLLDLLEE